MSQHAPWNTRNAAINNQAFYMKSLPLKNVKEFTIELPETFIPSSSSMVPYGDGYHMNMRLVNYRIDASGRYIFPDKTDIVRTRNILLTLDNKFNINNQVELHNTSNIPLYPKNILGLEDIRLFGTNELLCTYLEVNESRTPQICYCQYNPTTGDVFHIKALMVGNVLKCEKNWLPFIKDDEVYILYTTQPLRVYKLNRNTGDLTLVKETNIRPGLNLETFRGSGD